MPMYDYVCENCKKMFELIIPLAECGKIVKCKYCGKELVRLPSTPYFKVK